MSPTDPDTAFIKEAPVRQSTESAQAAQYTNNQSKFGVKGVGRRRGWTSVLCSVGRGGSRKTAGECHGLLAVQFGERPPRRRHPAARSGNMPITWSSHRRPPPDTCPPRLRVVQLFRS